MNKRIKAALAAPALVLALVAGAVGIVSAANATGEQVCGPLTSGKIDTTGDPATVTVTLSDADIAAGKVITGYCVKAGSANQEGGGPVYVPVDPPKTTITFGHPSGKAVSHYSYTVETKTPEVCEPPTTGTPPNCVEPEPEVCEPPTTGTPPNCVEPTTPPTTPTTPTVTPTVPTTPVPSTPVPTAPTPTETPDKDKDKDKDKPKPQPQPQPETSSQVTECVDGVFVTTVNGEVVAESGSCDESSNGSRTTLYAQEEGL